ncbi:MAG: hypothetical protein H6Q05_3623 [Acidobacteria bacterium]|nr:hypothetical protein [Acidobacteriota bacterium]
MFPGRLTPGPSSLAMAAVACRLTRPRRTVLYFAPMRRVAGSALIASLFLFLLSLPMLHFHPAAEHEQNAVLHSHMPQSGGADSSRIALGQDAEGNEPSEFESVPIDISALCPSGLSPAPAPDLAVLITADVSIDPDPQSECVRLPDPKAQAPPEVLIYHSLRSPPA